MRNIFCFFILLLVAQAASAQVFRPGRLVVMNGDTLNGLVANGAAETMVFKESKNAPQQIFQRKEILAFNFDGYDYEEHVIEVLRAKFPERVKDYLKILIDGGQVRLLQYEGKGLFNSTHVAYYLHEKGMEVPLRVNQDPRNFKVQMSLYFADYPELVAKIKSKELGYEQMPAIVTIFNDWYAMQPQPEPTPEMPKKEKKVKTKKVKEGSEESEN